MKTGFRFAEEEKKGRKSFEDMRGRSRALLNLSFSLLSPIKRHRIPKSPSPASAFLGFSSDCTTTTNVKNDKASSNSERDSMILEKFKLRKVKGSSETPQAASRASTPPASSSIAEKVTENSVQNEGEPAKVVTSFKELGLSDELIEAAGEMGIFIPSEIQCVGIPAVLEGKSVVFSSESGSGRTLAYLLPLIQLLRRDYALLGLKPQHPRAILLCATEEQCEECFNVAKFMDYNAQLKSSKDSGSPKKDFSNVPIGLIIGTPSEIVQYMEEGSVVPDEMKYLVLEEADCMFDTDLGPEIHKIIGPLKDQASNSSFRGFQSILVTSTITKILGEHSSLVKRLESNHAGQISAMLLEIDQTEVFDLTDSPDTLKKKVADAMTTLL
ncbi:Dead box ATP-dependent RNA helicase [Quillaja saponaria]|uniref:Dead box ATP-dependent RNA helicase n=1 Tax=Quillaja saponaria TaxID=32244 RepID=A0AAD7Q355_QUISA|nr:Dead box ATP-dependent RNA helicase [Quillaja saponaria]